ncbi:MAG: hypothetical protein K8J09_13420 [Planctomycetes bacterium]|nr:hypothetical protein [Planctomycetota bacterium]MCC7398974.1 hypothetical protein [Planctomycetota bacterium]
MPHRLLLLAATAGLLLAPSLLGQRVVVVDANNGPGTNHTTLAAAFADLQADDYVIVRAGNYAGAHVSTQHSFCLVGEGNPVVAATPGSYATTVEIAMWGGSQQRVSIRGMTFLSQNTGQWALGTITYWNHWPAPTVHLEDCVVDSNSPLADRVSLLATSVGLTAQRCDLGTTQVVDSIATFVDCTITGDDLSSYQGATQRAQTAIDVLRSTVWFVDCTVSAGDSNLVYAEPAACIGSTDYSNSITSHVYVCGNSTLRADQSPHPSWPAPYVFHNYAPWYPPGIVEYEGSVVMLPTPGQGIASGGLNVVQRSIACAEGSPAPLGGSFTTTVHGDANEIAFAFASMSTQPVNALGTPLLLDLATAVPIGFAVTNGSGDAAFPVAINNVNTLRGLVVEATGGRLTSTGALELTNPVAGLVH